MPIENTTEMRPTLRAVALAAAALLALPATAQTDAATPFYAGASLGVTQVSNVYRLASGSNSDRVTSAGLLAGVDTRLGRQHLTLDGSLQDNRYANTQGLNNKSYSLRGALNWQTIGNLSGVLSASSSRSLADFNAGNGVDPIFTKNTERNEEYSAIARLGVTTRYTFEGGWTYRKLDYSAREYDRFAYHQNSGTLGIFATPGGNVRLGLSARHTKGEYPRYPVGLRINPDTLQLEVVTAVNEYSRNDVDLTARWTPGGSSSLNARVSRSRTEYNRAIPNLRDFSGTTGSLGGVWQPTAKLSLNLQYSRDTGIESQVSTSDVNRIYTTWRFTGSYAMTGKISFTANASTSRGRRDADSGAAVFDAQDDNKTYSLGLRWAFTRSLSLACQYDHASRDSSVAQYIYTANSYGCTGQALVF